MTTTNKATFRLNRPKLGRTGFASLLCSVSFLALSGGALAVDECGPGADGGTVNCNLVAYPTGISYKAGSAHSNFTVNVGAAAGQAGAVAVGNPGIGMGTVSGAHGSQTLRVTGDVTVNTTTDHGLFAATGTGFVNIYTAAQVIVNSMGTHHGVYANVDTNSISSINMFSSADNGGGPAGSVSITGGNGHGLFAFNGQTGSAIASAGTGTSISTLGGAGIYAKSVSGNASASTDGSIVTTLGGFGIKGYAGGSSVNLSLGQNGSIQTQGASAHGIFAESVNANGDATVIVSGDIDTQSDQSEGVRAVSNGNVYVRVTAPGSINGGSSGGAGIKVDAGTDAMEEATIKIEGLVEARSDRAIHGGDSIELVNIEAGGTVVGYLELRENDDIVTNKGTWIARGSTNTDFGTGSDTFDNQALFVVIGNQSLDGLETFNNSGTISLQETDSGMFDNGPDFETLTIAADFTASGASRIEIDTALGDNTSSTDVVVLTGAIMGSTTLAINNLGGMGGATAGNGILVIDTSAATGVDASSFALDGGTIDVNGFIYSLVLGGDNNWYLQSVAPPPPPPSSMGNFASIGFGANWLWQDTLKSYQDRVGEVWDLLAPSGHQTAALGAGDYEQEAVLPGAGGRGIQQIWLRGQGGFLDHDGSSGSNPFSQNYVGFQGGADMGWRNLFGGDDLLIVGGFLGIVDSDINMGASAADARLHGFQGGLYMAYMDGALRIDGTVKADFLTVDLVDPDTATDVEGDATTWGAQIAAAYRFGFEGIGAGGYLEPFANLSFATSNIDSLLLGNASTVTFDEGETLWAGIGIKAATRFDVGGATLVPDVSVAYRGQLLDASQAVVGGSTLEADSQGSAVDLGLGMTVLGLNDHMTVNFSGNYLVGEEYDALSGQVAVKLTW